MQVITIGPLALDAVVLISLLSLGAMFAIAGIIERRYKLKLDAYLWYVVLAMVLAGRLVFVLRYWSDYQANWLSVFAIRDGGFSWPAAALAAAVVIVVIGMKKTTIRRAFFSTMAMTLLLFMAMYGVLQMRQPEQLPRLPAITLSSVTQQPVSLIEFQGKPMVINLWATWCPPCRREMPMLEAAQVAHPDVHFVFANQAESAEQINNYLQQSGIQLDNNLLDSNGQLAQLVNSRGLPTTLFIQADGQIKSARMGELSAATLRSYLSEIK